MSKKISVVIKDNELEEVINLNCKDPTFEETLGYVLCEIFDSPQVSYSIEVLDETKEND